MIKVHTNYLHNIFNPTSFEKTIRDTIAKAKQIQQAVPFDTLVFTGTSGVAMGFILAKELKVPMLLVRKEKDGSHFQAGRADEVLEGNISTSRYLVVDDTIASGNTFARVVKAVRGASYGAVCVGALLYADYGKDTRLREQYPYLRYDFDKGFDCPVWRSTNQDPVTSSQLVFNFEIPDPYARLEVLLKERTATP